MGSGSGASYIDSHPQLQAVCAAARGGGKNMLLAESIMTGYPTAFSVRIKHNQILRALWLQWSETRRLAAIAKKDNLRLLPEKEALNYSISKEDWL